MANCDYFKHIYSKIKAEFLSTTNNRNIRKEEQKEMIAMLKY